LLLARVISYQRWLFAIMHFGSYNICYNKTISDISLVDENYGNSEKAIA
jgi:hypothetical protein